MLACVQAVNHHLRVQVQGRADENSIDLLAVEEAVVIVRVGFGMTANGLHALLEIRRINVACGDAASRWDRGEEPEQCAAFCSRSDHAVVHNFIWVGSAQNRGRSSWRTASRQSGNASHSRSCLEEVAATNFGLIFHRKSPGLRAHCLGAIARPGTIKSGCATQDRDSSWAAFG